MLGRFTFTIKESIILPFWLNIFFNADTLISFLKHGEDKKSLEVKAKISSSKQKLICIICNVNLFVSKDLFCQNIYFTVSNDLFTLQQHNASRFQ